jgi:8-oxo-dGTP pyrophosphatase MutT (NUDIX family)
MNENTKASPERLAPAPAPAATTILLRSSSAGGFEVFLMRRHRGQSFMANAYVFPGGRVDEADAAAEQEACGGGFSGDRAQARLGECYVSADQARGLYFCALRELFEEAGVLIGDSDPALDFSRPEVVERFAGYRRRVHDGQLSLAELARLEGLVYRPLDLVAYSHWITPEIEKKRFDTWFFLVRLPPGQEAAHDDVELVESIWIQPDKALTEQAEGRLMLMPPTLKTMEELAAFDSLDRLFETASDKQVLPIMPQGFKTETGFGVLLPHDPEYNIPGLKQPPRPGETSRLVLENGQWRSQSKP